ncbi:MAG TPA: UDP-N-acetylmuramoyl-tripeptide--D-alanyl-D-alanine ligase [Rhodocyclaceae bacterium]|nr:UDP-N-acetylmuramoyl-tripeptide--D-alanyl-D-alanine ligase [Rhodocyclaceae bacterium]
MKCLLSDVASAVDGRQIGADVALAGVSTDTRSIAAGQLFVALKGERFDAHDFLAQAAGQGAAAVLVSAADKLPAGQPAVVVDDTRLALGRLAAVWRARFDIPVLAVTGSNGKTTTKEMIAAVLKAQFGDAVLATRGNLNNDIGLPLTLLGMDDHHQAAVIEMGMNHPGEIDYLTRIGAPTVALVTNAQRAHLQGMGDLHEVAREKGTIFNGLKADGVAVVNADDRYADFWCQAAGGHAVLTFGVDQPADVRGIVSQYGLETQIHLVAPQGEVEFTLNTPGRHNARNAMAAAAACLAAGVPLQAVAKGLAAFAGVKGRLQRRAGEHGAVILDDTYNANPDSVRAGIDVLAATVGRKILVLGDMGEIGDASAQYHDEVGGYAKSQGVDLLFALGDASQLAARNFGDGGRHFRNPEDLLAALRPELAAGTTVLVKGSRFMKMERIADAIATQEAA